MKTEDLKEKGLTDEQISFVMAENGKDIKKLQKEVETLTTERDGLKERAENAEETLKGFEGKDFEAMQREVDSWKEKAEKAEQDYNGKLAEREKADLLKEAFASIEFTSESAKRAVMNDISESVTVKNGKLIGFNDLLEEAKKNDASAFKSTDPEQNRAQFTTTATNMTKGNGNEIKSKADIYAKDEHGRYKLDATARQKAIAEHPEFF